MTYVAPVFRAKAFNCPHCGTYAHMDWSYLEPVNRHIKQRKTPIHAVWCYRCGVASYWIEDPIPEDTEATSGRMLVPDGGVAPLPHVDIPEDVKVDYEEARRVVCHSPRSAAALLRLSIQKLCIQLRGKGENLNDDIGEFVQKGLPLEVQRALDVVRVIGNNSVHPGKLSADDVADVANALFAIVNYVVDEMISKPKKLQQLYDGLPTGAREAIQRRDGK